MLGLFPFKRSYPIKWHKQFVCFLKTDGLLIPVQAGLFTGNNKRMPQSKETKTDHSPPTRINSLRETFRLLIGSSITQEFNEDKTEVIVHHPGLSHEAYSVRDGQPTLSSIFGLLIMARGFAYHKPIDESGTSYLDYSLMTDNIFTFMASCEIEIDKIMYDADVKKSPLDVKINLGNIGKTSLNSVAEVTLPSHGATLIRNVNQVVLIDKLTRKPTAVPEWWRNKYSPYTVRNQPLIIPRLVKPDQFYQYKLYIAWSDTDFYNHTSSISYSRFAIDAIQSASSNNFFKLISTETLLSGIKKIQMSFIGESAQGDLVDVCVWEDCEKPIAYCDFLIDGKTIFQCTVQYNTPIDYTDVGI